MCHTCSHSHCQGCNIYFALCFFITLSSQSVMMKCLCIFFLKHLDHQSKRLKRFSMSAVQRSSISPNPILISRNHKHRIKIMRTEFLCITLNSELFKLDVMGVGRGSCSIKVILKILIAGIDETQIRALNLLIKSVHIQCNSGCTDVPVEASCLAVFSESLTLGFCRVGHQFCDSEANQKHKELSHSRQIYFKIFL